MKKHNVSNEMYLMQEQMKLYEDDTEPFSVWSQKELDDYFMD